jgi:tRNA1Val (adenine37-N6)-methyltransferase
MNNERIDDLQCDGLRLIQNPSHFCFGTDAVLLANFAKAEKNERVMDLCTGTGVIPILMSAKTRAKHFTGIELVPDMADMAQRSVVLNHLQDKITVVCGDIKKAAELCGSAVFDVVTVNPPYLNAGEVNQNEALALARHEIACTLADIAHAAAKLLRFGGRLYMVHRAHRLADIVCALREHKLEPKRLQFAGKQLDLVLVEASLGGKAWLTVEAVTDSPYMR